MLARPRVVRLWIARVNHILLSSDLVSLEGRRSHIEQSFQACEARKGSGKLPKENSQAGQHQR